MADRSVSVPMTLNDLETRNAMGQTDLSVEFRAKAGPRNFIGPPMFNVPQLELAQNDPNTDGHGVPLYIVIIVFY